MVCAWHDKCGPVGPGHGGTGAMHPSNKLYIQTRQVCSPNGFLWDFVLHTDQPRVAANRNAGTVVATTEADTSDEHYSEGM